MQYNDSIINAYLEGRPISKEKLYPYIKNYHTPDSKRKDVVKELNQQLQSITEKFPVFNTHLWSLLFHDMDDALDKIHICPVVGGDTLSTQCVKGEEVYLFIDLICVADYTRIVSQMTYILKNHLMYEVTRLCILKKYPLDSKHYASLLDTSAFVHGLSYYLSWNESCSNYKFYTDAYDLRKEQAFGLLLQAMNVDNKAMQHKILLHIRSGDLWNQFPAAAGMFYFDDIYRELGEKGICQLFERGPKGFVKHIYES